jgi:hypothetical protein
LPTDNNRCDLLHNSMGLINKKPTQCLVTAFNTRIINTGSRINPLLRDLTTQTTTKTIKCATWVVFDKL